MGKFKGFIISYLMLTLVLTAVTVAAFRLVWPAQYPPMLFLIPVTFVLMLALMLALWNLMEKQGKPAQLALMIYRPVKMLLLLALVLVYILTERQYAIPFVAAFAVYYLVLSVCETLMMVKVGKK